MFEAEIPYTGSRYMFKECAIRLKIKEISAGNSRTFYIDWHELALMRDEVSYDNMPLNQVTNTELDPVEQPVSIDDNCNYCYLDTLDVSEMCLNMLQGTAVGFYARLTGGTSWYKVNIWGIESLEV